MIFNGLEVRTNVRYTLRIYMNKGAFTDKSLLFIFVFIIRSYAYKDTKQIEIK